METVTGRARAQASLTVRPTGRAGGKPGPSDLRFRRGIGTNLTDKSYPGDNRVVAPDSPHRRRGSLPRCRLSTSWGRRRSQGLVCSPIKVLRELGSERRETVRTLSGVNGGFLREVDHSTRGPG